MRSLMQRRGAGPRGVVWCPATLFTLMMLVLAAAPASAHTELTSSDPEDGATVARLPATVELSFSEAVSSTGVFVVVADPDGVQVDVGEPKVVDGTVSQSTTGVGPAGTYTLAFRVVSGDGHPISGELDFTVRSAAGAQLSPDPQSDAPSNEAPSKTPSAQSSSGQSSSGQSSSGQSSSGQSSGDTASVNSSSEDGFVSSNAPLLALGAIGLVAAAVLVRAGVRGRH